jgi:uncharacterized membrane protein YkoI
VRISWFVLLGMKKGNLTSLVLLSSALAIPAYAEKVQLEQLPSDLQEKIRAQVGSNRVEDIDRETRNGRTVYEVAFKENGQHREIQIEHNDSSSAAATSSSSSVSSQKVRYEELPENVKRVADAQLQGAEVNDIDRQTKNGRTTYEIGFKRNDGTQQELLVAEDGQILSGNQTSVATSSSSTPPGGNQPYWNYRGVRPAQTGQTRVIPYDQVPSNIRTVAESRLREGHVSQVQRTIRNGGDISYQIDFRKEDGRNQRLVVADDGRVISDQFLTAGVGSPASVQSGSSSSSTAATATSPVQLLSAQEITHSQLPVGVARVVKGYTTNANIEEIHRGTWNGREVYQVTYRDNSNQQVRLQLDENGQVIYTPNASAPASATQNLINNIGRLLDNNN